MRYRPLRIAYGPHGLCSHVMSHAIRVLLTHTCARAYPYLRPCFGVRVSTGGDTAKQTPPNIVKMILNPRNLAGFIAHISTEFPIFAKNPTPWSLYVVSTN